MKTRYKLLFSVLFAWAQVFAPALLGRAGGGVLLAQEAFYIYQNDGHFNGFFYDEVESIEYSCVDTLGRVFAFPVSQEIVTADSTYRIMLTAIDSVSFVQPEVRFNPRLRNLVTDSLMRYVAAVDSLKLTFTADLPTDQRPIVGDVIVGFDGDRCGDGFGGKVKALQEVGGQLVVLCDSLTELSDIFDQFITVEQYVKEDDAHPMRHRIAGMNRKRSIPDAEFNIDNYPINTSWDFHLPFRWNSKEGDATASFNFHFGVGVKATGVYDIRPSILRFYIKTDLTEVNEHSGTVDVDGKLFGPATKPFNSAVEWIARKLGFPQVCPVFQVNIMPEAMLRAEAHFHAKFGYGLQATRLTETLEFSDFEFKKPIVHVESYLGGYEKDADFVFQAELNGFVQAGIQVPIELTTNHAVRNIFKASAGVYFYIGPKVSGNLTLDAWAMRRPGWYNLLKESKLDFSLCAVDWEAKASLEYWGGAKQDLVLADGSFGFGNKSVWLVPEYEGLSAKFKPGSTNTITASVSPKRDVLFDSHIGLGIYDMSDKLVAKWYDESRYYSWLLSYSTTPVTHDFTIEKSGRYRLRPLSRLKRMPSLDIPYVPDEEVEFTIDNSHITANPTPLVANNIGGMRQLTIDSDLHEFMLLCDADWLTFNTQTYGAKTRGISFDPLPSGEIERTTTLVIIGYNEDRTFSKGIEVTVVQNIIGSNEPALSTDPTHLEFEANSGQKAVTLLTNCSDASVQKSASWIHASIADGKVKVSVDANPSLDERRDSVTLMGSKDGTAATCLIEVLQEGVLSLSTHRMEYVPEGGTKDAIVKSSGFPITIECMDDWYTATLDGNHLAVVAEENWTLGTREGEVVLKVDVDGTEVATSITLVQDAWVICEPSEMKNVGAWGTIEDVIIKSTKLKDLSIDAVCDWVGIGMTDNDTRLTISVDENEGEAREGAASISGYKGTTKYTLLFPVSQKAGGDLEMPFEFWGAEDMVFIPEGGNSYLYGNGSTEGVEVTTNRSWLKASFVQEDEDRVKLVATATANPDEWYQREGTITLTKQMSPTEIYHYEISATQQALADMEPRIGGGSAYISYDPETPDTISFYSRYVDDVRVRENDNWFAAYRRGDNKLIVDASINRENTEREGTITLVGTNRYGKRAESTVTITQSPYAGYNHYRLYGGICIGLRHNGRTYDDEIWNGAWSTYLPGNRGVYGQGFSSGNFEQTVTTMPDYTCTLSVNYTSADGKTKVSANIQNLSGVFNGYITCETEYERVSFNIHDMPVSGYTLPSRTWEPWANRGMWSGDGGSDYVVNGYGEDGHITSFEHLRYSYKRDEKGNIIGREESRDTSPVNVTFYIYREGSIGGTDYETRLPLGHPEAK